MEKFNIDNLESEVFLYSNAAEKFIKNNFSIAIVKDHFWISFSSKEEYESAKKHFHSRGSFLREVIIKERRVSVFLLNDNIAGFPKIEFGEPRKDEITKTEIKHVAFLTDNIIDVYKTAKKIKKISVQDMKEFMDNKMFKMRLKNIEIEFHDKTV